MTAPLTTDPRSASAEAALLTVDGLCAGYGKAQVLDGVSFSIGREAVCVVGRNGMGKSTLCNTIMGLVPSDRRHDPVRRRPTSPGMAPEQVARRGIAYVPQGRRLFPSLTVDEHLRMLAARRRGKRWTPESVYELFPRLAERRRHGGAELSGGEQQMLAVAPGAAAQRPARDHGRAVRGARTDHRRHADRCRPPAGERGRRRARRRAEPAGGDRDRRAPARDGVRPDRDRDHRTARSPATPSCNAATSESTDA